MAIPLPSRILVRISLAIGAALSLLIIAGGLWNIHTHSELIYEEQKRSVAMIANGLAGAVAREMVTKDFRALEYRLRQTLSLPGVRSAIITDLDGKVLSSAKRISPAGAITVSYEHTTMLPPNDVQSDTTMKNNLNVGWHRIEVGVPLGWVRVEISNRHLSDVIARVRKNTIYTAIIGALIIAILMIDALMQMLRRLRARESEVEQKETRLSNMAYFDQLTGLPNRSLMSDRLHHAIARSKREHKLLAICFVDLDRFKRINDNFGHEAGDSLLQQTSQRLIEGIREGDNAARYGGDEFVLLLEGLKGRNELETIINRLLASLAKPYRIGNQLHNVSASIGVTLYPNDNSDADQLIRHADHSMYAAKESGRNCYRLHAAADNIPANHTATDS